MGNGGFLDDTFEKALEAGQSMVKGGAKQIKQTFNPLQMLKNAGESGKEETEGEMKKMQEQMGKKGENNTPLDFDKLQKSYGKQDEAQAKALANRFFQLVKSGEEKVLADEHRKETEEKRRDAYLEQQKKQKEAQAKQQQQGGEMPQGKEHKSILGKKKKSGAPPATAELKPSQGKQ